MLDIRMLVDCAAEQNLAPSEYFSGWQLLADWQLDALKCIGLLPHHRLLDIGCGAMRLGFTAVNYLDDDGYYGVDGFAPYLALARRIATKIGMRKRFTLLQSSEFEFSRLGTQFNYAIAQSVFTHLSAEQCDACMRELEQAMLPGGVFLFTYLIGVPKTQGFLYGGLAPMQRSAIIDPSFFDNLGKRFGARFESLDLSHPTGQQVGLFRYPG
jgi:cyclopropane fatty-acyl-phospholipid synthase-like methyltransferase